MAVTQNRGATDIEHCPTKVAYNSILYLPIRTVPVPTIAEPCRVYAGAATKRNASGDICLAI